MKCWSYIPTRRSENHGQGDPLYMTPKRAGKAKEIAAAALDQFTQAGFYATSLEKIAASAGIGKSTVYEYYKNKEELYIAAVQEAFDQWFEDIENIAAQTQDPVERLAAIAELFLECDAQDAKGEHRFFFEIIMQTVMEGGIFFERNELITDAHKRFIRIIADILLDGVSRGQLKPEIARDAEKLAVTFLAFMDGITLYTMAASSYIDIRGQVTFFLRHLTTLMRPDAQKSGSLQTVDQSMDGNETVPL